MSIHIYICPQVIAPKLLDRFVLNMLMSDL
jgi:hypothetical protein